MTFAVTVAGWSGNPHRLNDLPPFSCRRADMTRNAPAQSRHPPGAGRKPPIRLNPPGFLEPPGFTGADSMPAIAADLMRAVPSIVPSDIPNLSDDECLLRLTHALAEQDFEHLDEVAQLIGRLAVAIE
jgi:hypothetical protein